MEPISVMGLLIIGILALFLSRALSVVVHVAFYVLLIALGAILFFGVSLNQVIDWGTNAILWAF